MKEIQSIEPKDNYMFQRTWIKGFYEDELFEEVTKLVRNKKEIKEMQVYEIPKYEKPEIDKEELRKVKKFAERIRMSTEYKFEDENLNQKIYEYEKLMIEIRVNADKLKKEQKKNFTENFKEEECDFLILARNFNHEEVKEYLDRYITKSITDMNNMMKEVRKEYADEMDFMLQIIEKRRTI